jgi:uncharacterized integral membrane protein (TIGR00698 family)
MQDRWQTLNEAARQIAALLPGVGLCLLITGAAVAAQAIEEHALGHPYVEALVAAILIGILVRTIWIPSELWQAGIAFSAKQLLETAVALLGASISFAAIAASGSLLIALTAGTVAVTLAASFALSRLLGLPTKLSLLIACGNSICGNSAIATVAPLIRASSDDIAASISFTAILGVLIVLGLPLLIPLLGLSATQYGILAGLTVYAVPQVLAATIPAGLISTHIGTLVKLVRVLMLGPVALGISVLAPRFLDGPQASRSAPLSLFKLVPWFILSFLALATARSFGIVPDWIAAHVTKIASVLTVLSMAALGLGVDIRVLSSVGARVTAAVTLSLLLLLGLAIFQVRYFQ